MRNNISKRMIISAAIALVAIFGVDPTDAAGEVKIGSVSMQVIINDSDAGIDAVAELKKRAEAENRIVKSKQEAYKTMKKDFEQQRLVSRPEILEGKERELQRLKRDLELYGEDSNRALQRTQSRLTNKIITDVRKIITEFAKKKGYALIVENSEGPSPISGMVLYVDKGADLTTAILKLYNEQYKKESQGKN